MRTHAQHPRAVRRGPEPGSPSPSPAGLAPGTAPPTPSAGLPHGLVREMAGAAGNRAVSELLGHGTVVQRYIGADAATTIAGQLHEAMEGWGTDEEAIYGALAGRRGEDVREIRQAYRAYGNLDADLRDELTDDEFERIRPALEAAEEGPMTRATREVEAIFRAADVAAQLHAAFEGWGTEEDQIFNALSGRTPTEIRQILDAYEVDYGHSLEDDLRDELSGDDLERALQQIGRTDTGRVESREREQLVEGIDATVRGDFRYRLSATRLDIEAPVKFVPQSGTTVQLDNWNQGVASTWNQFAFVEPGGRRVELHMAFANDSGATREVRVLPNAKAGVYASPDRATAGQFYQVMPGDTVAHEFGHLLGLADEYQRSAADFEVVTGETAPSLTSTSPTGMTAQQVADQLHGALTGAGDGAAHERAAEQVLINAGLLGGGAPQQGEFAEAVRSAYDASHGGSGGTALIPALQALPGNWWTTSVFSYASGTVMGLQGRYGLAPHEHPVMPRHLREFLAIVRNRWPDADWSIQ